MSRDQGAAARDGWVTSTLESLTVVPQRDEDGDNREVLLTPVHRVSLDYAAYVAEQVRYDPNACATEAVAWFTDLLRNGDLQQVDVLADYVERLRTQQDRHDSSVAAACAALHGRTEPWVVQARSRLTGTPEEIVLTYAEEEHEEDR